MHVRIGGPSLPLFVRDGDAEDALLPSPLSFPPLQNASLQRFIDIISLPVCFVSCVPLCASRFLILNESVVRLYCSRGSFLHASALTLLPHRLALCCVYTSRLVSLVASKPARASNFLPTWASRVWNVGVVSNMSQFLSKETRAFLNAFSFLVVSTHFEKFWRLEMPKLRVISRSFKAKNPRM